MHYEDAKHWGYNTLIHSSETRSRMITVLTLLHETERQQVLGLPGAGYELIDNICVDGDESIFQRATPPVGVFAGSLLQQDTFHRDPVSP